MIEAIPWKHLIIPQIFNFVIFVGVLCYFVRKPINEILKKNADSFLRARDEAKEAKIAAENRFKEAEKKLREIEQSAAGDLELAKKGAEALKIKVIQDAKTLAQRQEIEAASMTQFEMQHAASLLRLEIVSQATEQANALLKDRTDKALRTKLNDEFIRKMKAT